ncbi:MAG: hypothetical protein JEZ11_07120 [Desulfobacterales bacterium]|nr:hypothetical protein [Desulfobacterales bacterium]
METAKTFDERIIELAQLAGDLRTDAIFNQEYVAMLDGGMHIMERKLWMDKRLKSRLVKIEKKMGLDPEGRWREFLKKYYRIISSCQKTRIPPQDETLLERAGLQISKLCTEYPQEATRLGKEIGESLGTLNMAERG